MSQYQDIKNRVSAYYAGRLQEHGTTPKGVDWNSVEAQEIRFAQILKIIPPDKQGFSVNDYGCGYGALVSFIGDKHFTYTGYDLAPEMIAAAQTQHQNQENCRFTSDESQLAPADYTVASGIFSVSLEFDKEQWLTYLLDTINQMWQLSTAGMSFNCLTTYSDFMRPDLYYADPCFVFDYCKKQFSRQVALLHDYGLYEFTILVRRQINP